MALKTTMKRRAGELRDRGQQGVQAVVERQESVLAKRHYDGFLLDRQNHRSRNGGTRPVIHRGLALLPLGDGLRVDAVAPRKSPHALLTMLYRSTDRRCRAGAPMKNLSHSASFHPLGKYAPLNAGTKHLVDIVRKRLGLESSLYQILQILSVTLFEKPLFYRHLTHLTPILSYWIHAIS